MRVNNQEQSLYYGSMGYSGTLQDKENAFYAAGGPPVKTEDPTSRAQKIRVLTDTTGNFTWTYPTPYPVGIIPVIQLTVEDGTAGAAWNHKIVKCTETYVQLQITKTNSVTVLGISVLGISANPQAYVHINAGYPST